VWPRYPSLRDGPPTTARAASAPRGRLPPVGSISVVASPDFLCWSEHGARGSRGSRRG
jgi:hypothetical protein